MNSFTISTVSFVNRYEASSPGDQQMNLDDELLEYITSASTTMEATPKKEMLQSRSPKSKYSMLLISSI